MKAPICSRRESGQTLPLIAVMMLTLLCFLGLVIDVGNAYRVKDALQASADAAAAAGAGTLTMTYPANTANAIGAAKSYTSATGGKNSIKGVPAANVAQTIATSCVQSTTAVPCTTANTVTVSETASVPTYFLSLLGFNTLTMTAKAQACSPCNELPLDIELVIDRTGSMSSDNKMTNLRKGLLTGFLPGLDNTNDSVGLTVLPPDVSGTNDVCDAADSSNYDSTHPTYNVVPLTDDYMTSPGTLDSTSTLIQDIKCLQPGGPTDYADALEAGYAAVQAQGRSGVQKVIVLLSDGAANIGQNCDDVVTTTTTGSGRTSTRRPRPPRIRIRTACSRARRRQRRHHLQGGSKVLVYSILYGDQSDAPYCKDYDGDNESPQITPQTAMEEIAGSNSVTGASNYFEDPDPTDLVGIFQQISADMSAGTSRITG